MACNYYYEKKKIKSVDCHIFSCPFSDFNIEIDGISDTGYRRLTSIYDDSRFNENIPIVEVSAGMLPGSPVYYNRERYEKYDYPSVIIWNNNHITPMAQPISSIDYFTSSKCVLCCDAILIRDGLPDIILPTDKSGVSKSVNRLKNITEKNTRTIIGQTDNGIVICVIDRKSWGSKGITLDKALEIMLELLCTDACVLSAGNDSQFIYKNEIMTNSKYERRICPGLVVYGGRDCEKIANSISVGKVISKCGVDVFAFPGMLKSKILYSLRYKTKVLVLDVEPNGWYKIQFNNTIGYVHGTQIKLI